MNDLRRDFLRKSTDNLEDVKKKLLSESLSQSWRREAFRTLHTIKGTAQTFGFDSSGRLAHELENLLSAADIVSFKTFRNLFLEGIELLKNSFDQESFELPARFIENLSSHLPKSVKSSKFVGISPKQIPGEISAQLSQAEKLALNAALQSKKNLYLFEVGFNLADLTAKFKEFRETLNQSGEIIATSSSARFIGEIGFKILFASAAKSEKINEIASDYSAEVIFQTSRNDYPEDLRGVLSQVAAHGESVAKKLDKKINFEILAEEIRLSSDKLKLIFDVLLHLVRNAVDHAFAASGGTIKIHLKTEKDNLRLIVADNGSGVDLEKLKSKAVERNLISAEENLSRQATLDLIFQSELSTAAEITEISGRGVGLDAVKYAVENAGGVISVASKTGEGAIFEISLPK